MDISETSSLFYYLAKNGHIQAEEKIRCHPLSGGVSCHTILIEREEAQDLVLKQALNRLKVSEVWTSDPKRIHVEAAAMRTLANIAPQGSIPTFFFEDFDHHIIGMEAIPFPHKNWKTILLRGEFDSEYFVQLGQILGSIHQKSTENDELCELFRDVQFFESLRIEPYYKHTAKAVSEASDFLIQLIAETRRAKSCLVHGDFSPKNILIRNRRLILLDHEVTHFGDGAFDIGFSMTHFISKAEYLPHIRNQILENATLYWKTYCTYTQPTKRWEQRAVKHTIACMLARIKGKSPLEYLNEHAQKNQLSRSLNLVGKTPESMIDLLNHLAS